MPEQKLSAVKSQAVEEDQGIEPDEVDAVLTALRLLTKTVSSPVVRACLEEARSDIAHLASTGDDRLGDGADAAAAA